MSRSTEAPAYLALGHVSADLQTDGSASLGGSVAYAARTARRLGWTAGIVTRAEAGSVPAGAAPSGAGRGILEGRGVLDGLACRIGASAVTTTFTNTYDAAGNRSQRLHHLAAPLTAEDVPTTWRRPRILHLAPIADELDATIADRFQAELIGMTPQGWLRRLVPGEPVTPGPWRVPAALLDRADAVVLSQEDIAGLPGGLETCIEQVVSRTCVLIVTCGSAGAIAFSARDGRLEQPAFAVPTVDPTGAGDVFAASFFVRLLETGELAVALRFAAAAAALSVGATGLQGVPDRPAVEALLQRGPR